MIELRDYQERDIERLRAEMRASRRVLYVSPTGSGMAYGEVLSIAATFDDLKLIGAVRGYRPGWPYKVAPELGIAIPGPTAGAR